MKDSSFFIDETDHLILMHKEVHFGGSFPAMIAYYEQDKVGVQEEFYLQRIQELAEIEKSGSDLSEIILDDEEKNQVRRAKEAFSSLQKLCDLPSCPAQKIALLILSEDEEPLFEIEEVCACGKEAIKGLLALIRDENFYSPLFPGYGFAPGFAATCLGKLQAVEAVIPLFENLSLMEFFGEERSFQALAQIGSPAKEFLLSRVKKGPFTQENENAAIALSFFQRDPSIISTCLDLLEIKAVQSIPSFFVHLLSCLTEIKDEASLLRLKKIGSSSISSDLKEELDWIIKNS